MGREQSVGLVVGFMFSDLKIGSIITHARAR